MSIGTRLLTWISGTFVGEDELGNRYFRDLKHSRNGREKRWVIYKNQPLLENQYDIGLLKKRDLMTKLKSTKVYCDFQSRRIQSDNLLDYENAEKCADTAENEPS